MAGRWEEEWQRGGSDTKKDIPEAGTGVTLSFCSACLGWNPTYLGKNRPESCKLKKLQNSYRMGDVWVLTSQWSWGTVSSTPEGTFLNNRTKEQENSLMSLLMPPPFRIVVPPLWTHLTLTTSLGALFPNTVTMGSRTSMYEFWGDTILSITISNI